MRLALGLETGSFLRGSDVTNGLHSRDQERTEAGQHSWRIEADGESSNPQECDGGCGCDVGCADVVLPLTRDHACAGEVSLLTELFQG